MSDALNEMINWFTKPPQVINSFIYGVIVCCAIKLVSDISRGYWRYLNKGSFVEFWLQQRLSLYPNWLRIVFSANIYKMLIILHAISLIAFSFGWYPKICLVLILTYYSYQNFINFKYHICYFILITFTLLIGSFFPEDTWLLPAMVSSLTSCLYIFSAFRKISEFEFRSGVSLGISLKHLKVEGKKRVFKFDNALASILSLGNFSQNKQVFQLASIGVIIIELALPLLLYSHDYKLYGVFLGIAMHGLFTLIEPRTLFHFSTMTIVTYILF